MTTVAVVAFHMVIISLIPYVVYAGSVTNANQMREEKYGGGQKIAIPDAEKFRRTDTIPGLSFEDLNNAPHLNYNPLLCVNATLFGRAHRGGWHICESILKPAVKSGSCIVYSFGLGADWSFDDAVEQEGCEVHGFDPSGLLWRQGMHGSDYSGIDYAKQYPSAKKHFHNWGLGVLPIATYTPGTVPQNWPGLGDPQMSKSNSEDWVLRSLEQTMKDLNHLNSSSIISILKIDVEGSEWDALISFFNSKVVVSRLQSGKIRQLLLELHWDPHSRSLNRRHDMVMKKIQSMGFFPWHINRHEGSDCCLDVSYIWKPTKKHGVA